MTKLATVKSTKWMTAYELLSIIYCHFSFWDSDQSRNFFAWNFYLFRSIGKWVEYKFVTLMTMLSVINQCTKHFQIILNGKGIKELNSKMINEVVMRSGNYNIISLLLMLTVKHVN